MLDYNKLYLVDRPLFNKCGKVLELLDLCRISDYIYILKEEKGVVNYNIDTLLIDEILKIPHSKEILKEYYTRPVSKSELKHQIYCLIKDNECRVVQEWYLEYKYKKDNNIEDDNYDKKKIIDGYRANGYIVDTLANVYMNAVKNVVISCSNSKVFSSLKDAAKWCIETGKSKATVERATTQLLNKLNKGTAYGLTWKEEVQQIEVQNLNYIFLP